MFRLQLARLFGNARSGTGRRAAPYQKPVRSPLQLECLEDRLVPSSYLGPTTNTFAVLAGSTVTNTGPTVVDGNLGVSPGGAVTGFAPGIVINGTMHVGDAYAATAQGEVTTSYNTLAGLPFTQSLTGQDLGGLTLLPGVYNFTSSAQLTGTLTLNDQGNPNAVFVFQIATALTTSSNSAVVFSNNSPDTEVYWQVGSSATLGVASAFAGNIVAYSSVALDTGASIQLGRALAQNGGVTMESNLVTTGTLPFGSPTVTLNPMNQTISAGGNVTMTAAASNGNPSLTTVQWQVSTDGGATFSNLINGGVYSGTNTTTLSISGPTTNYTGYEYRAVFSNAVALSATTTAATLTVLSTHANAAYNQAYDAYVYDYGAYVTGVGSYSAMNYAYSSFYYAYYAYYYSTLGETLASENCAAAAYSYGYNAAYFASVDYSANGNAYSLEGYNASRLDYLDSYQTYLGY